MVLKSIVRKPKHGCYEMFVSLEIRKCFTDRRSKPSRVSIDNIGCLQIFISFAVWHFKISQTVMRFT